MKQRISFLAMLSMLIACQSGNHINEKTGRAIDAQKDSTTNFYYDDLARYLAGLELPEDSALHPYTDDKEYKFHKEKMTQFWEKVRHDSIAPITAWRENKLSQNPNGMTCNPDQAAMYPLSGADIINLYTLCPHAKEYIMIAVEKAGDLPHPEKHSDRFYAGLSAMRYVINNIADRNYFFSAHMREKITHNTEIPGIGPVLLTFTSGLGWRIVNFEKIYLAPDGVPIINNDPSIDNTPRGVRIWFRVPDDSRLRSLTYIQQYLNNETVSDDRPLARFVKTKRGAFMLLKAAIYLMHNQDFQNVQNLFVTIPNVIIQDDSGFKYVDLRNHFDISIYGIFDRPALIDASIPQRNQIQPELTAFYKEKNPEKLNFHFGYGSLRKPPVSNLMVAHRKSVVHQKSKNSEKAQD